MLICYLLFLKPSWSRSIIVLYGVPVWKNDIKPSVKRNLRCKIISFKFIITRHLWVIKFSNSFCICWIWYFWIPCHLYHSFIYSRVQTGTSDRNIIGRDQLLEFLSFRLNPLIFYLNILYKSTFSFHA